MHRRIPTFAVLMTIALAALAVGATSCSLIEGDDKEAEARVSLVRFSTESGADGAPLNARNFFNPSSREIRASVTLENAKPGMKIRGRWFQLGTQNSGPEGQEVAGGEEVVLADSDVQQGGLAGVSFFLRSSSGIPADSWLLRVYQDDVLVKTSAFIVTPAAPATGATAPPTGSPGPTATPASYTVAAGDTLQSIATRFKPANEDVQAFLTRIVQLNNIAPTAALTPGQALRIPPANP